MLRAYVGLSTPVGYDYHNGPPDTNLANAVLENYMGLLLCYDEIWFPAREFCPIDMQALPYVRFIEDDQSLWEQALIAAEQHKVEWGTDESEFLGEVSERGKAFTETTSHILKAATFDIALDNHSRGASEMGQGNCGDPHLFAVDAGVAACLEREFGRTDLIINSRLSQGLRGAQEQWSTHTDVVHPSLLLTEELVPIRTVDYLGPKGAYHEAIEDLRSHERINEFRQMLAELSLVGRDDVMALASEVNERVDLHARDVLDRFLKGRGRLMTIGSAAVGTGGNFVQPGVGSAINLALNTVQGIQEGRERRRVAWSLFVLDARRRIGSA